MHLVGTVLTPSLLVYPLIGIKLRTVRMQGEYTLEDEQDIRSGLLKFRKKTKIKLESDITICPCSYKNCLENFLHVVLI